jgi:hypothetical protein
VPRQIRFTFRESEFEKARRTAASLFLSSNFLHKHPSSFRTPSKININADNDKMHPNAEPSSTPPKTTSLVLIQDSQEHGSQQNNVQIPAELLNSLLARVNRIDNTLFKLQNDNAELRRELSTIRQSCGGESTLFPKLPLELRR